MVKPKNKDNGIGQLVAQKIAEQHQQLVQDNWPDISKTMDADPEKEVKITFGTVITNRPAEEGNVASRDSRIVTTVSMSLGKLSDKCESPFPMPDQLELAGKATDPQLD